MLPCHSCYSYGTWRSKELGGFKVIVWMEAEGVSHKKSKGAPFMGELTPQVFYLNYLHLFSLFWSKKSYMICTA